MLSKIRLCVKASIGLETTIEGEGKLVNNTREKLSRETRPMHEPLVSYQPPHPPQGTFPLEVGLI